MPVGDGLSSEPSLLAMETNMSSAEDSISPFSYSSDDLLKFKFNSEPNPEDNDLALILSIEKKYISKIPDEDLEDIDTEGNYTDEHYKSIYKNAWEINKKRSVENSIQLIKKFPFTSKNSRKIKAKGHNNWFSCT